MVHVTIKMTKGLEAEQKKIFLTGMVEHIAKELQINTKKIIVQLDESLEADNYMVGANIKSSVIKEVKNVFDDVIANIPINKSKTIDEQTQIKRRGINCNHDGKDDCNCNNKQAPQYGLERELEKINIENDFINLENDSSKKVNIPEEKAKEILEKIQKSSNDIIDQMMEAALGAKEALDEKHAIEETKKFINQASKEASSLLNGMVDSIKSLEKYLPNITIDFEKKENK